MKDRLLRYDKKSNAFLPAETKDLRAGDIIRILPSQVNRVVRSDPVEKISPHTGRPFWSVDIQH